MQLERLADTVPAFSFMAASKILGEEAANAAGSAATSAKEKGMDKCK